MIRAMTIFVVCFVLFAPQAMAKPKLLSLDLAEDHVDITTGFNGAHLKLFGVQDEPGDIAITITGPERKTIVRKKEHVFALWMNRRSMSFENVPVYYRFAASRDVEKIAGPKVLKENRIGLNAMRFKPDSNDDEKSLKSFQDALIRNKQAQGLYPPKAEVIKFIDEHFFRASFYIPSNAPVGTYTIKTFLLQNGAVKDVKITDVKVAQVGTSAAIFDFAQGWSFAYGLLCVLFALSSGWLSSVIRQRLR